MQNEDIKMLVVNSENAAAEFKRARGSVSVDFYCLVHEGGDKGGRWIIKEDKCGIKG